MGRFVLYEDIGTGEQTVVMMHGWTISHEVFSPCVPEISKKARCILYDQKGHGGSKAANHDFVTMDTLVRDLNELIRGLDLRNVTLLGWSMGAGVAMKYASDYGCGRLRRIVLCDMSPKLLNDANWKLGLYKGSYRKEDAERDAKKNFFSAYRAFVIAAILRLAKVPRLLLRRPLKKQLAACDVATLKTVSASMQQIDYRESIGRISVPVSYFYASPGTLFSTELADWYRAHVSAPFEAVAFENSSHMLIRACPEQFTREVVRLL